MNLLKYFHYGRDRSSTYLWDKLLQNKIEPTKMMTGLFSIEEDYHE